MVSEVTPLLRNRVHSNDSVKSDDEKFAENYGMETPEKTIGPFPSFVLIANNIAGPGLMGLPLLFQQAGILPVTASILLICLCASFVGCSLSETIARIPMNSNFDLNVEYSSAFRIIMGRNWYILAEIFFLLACMVQVITGLVETAQSLDGFIASYLLGETYALSVYPTLKFLNWSPTNCVVTPTDDCTTPFASDGDGTLIITLGYILTTAIFMPFGRGHIKETMTVQLISFGCLVLLLLEFEAEFVFVRGLSHSINWFGEGQYSQLVGVILFNYAFAITVPAWLSEKTTETSINKTIWTASIFSSVLYISFGVLAAFSFQHCSESLLTMLSSNEVSFLTRICAAIFGLTIIGAGVPVFCVIIKNTLYWTGTCNAYWSFFIGSIFPYSTAWCLYKGDLLINALNWAGLVVNGMAAFCLPLILSWWYFAGRDNSLTTSSDEGRDVEIPTHQSNRKVGHDEFNDEAKDFYRIESAIPGFLLPYRSFVIIVVVVMFATAIVSTIVTDILFGITPS